MTMKAAALSEQAIRPKLARIRRRVSALRAGGAGETGEGVVVVLAG